MRTTAASGGLRFRPDDVLELECPFTETAVTEISRFHVSVRWPWLEVDPQAKNFSLVLQGTPGLRTREELHPELGGAEHRRIVW